MVWTNYSFSRGMTVYSGIVVSNGREQRVEFVAEDESDAARLLLTTFPNVTLIRIEER